MATPTPIQLPKWAPEKVDLFRTWRGLESRVSGHRFGGGLDSFWAPEVVQPYREAVAELQSFASSTGQPYHIVASALYNGVSSTRE